MTPFNFEKACLAQRTLAQKIRLESLKRPLKLIGGADFAIFNSQKKIGAALVILDAVNLTVIERVLIVKELSFPYIPGFLCFREGPVFLQALKKVKSLPNVWFIDGNGLAHPRRMGLATFIGVMADIPTIGCAKKAYFPFNEPAQFRGAFTLYRDRKGEKVGFCLRTKTGVKPIFVSPGHRVSFEDCLFLALEFSQYRFPEPLRQAHILAKEIFKS
ncbi:MAG: endonuclease V [Candidatus Aminicenantes bacterium]|nr:endonuclease V [Candidatus Aminicenantes bacterium]